MAVSKKTTVKKPDYTFFSESIMKDKPPPDTISIKSLRIARSLSQNDVAEAIGTNANTISRWERSIAIPSLYYRRKLADLFQVDPQELFSDLNGKTDKTIGVLPPEPRAGLPNETENVYQTDQTTEGPPPESQTRGDSQNKTENAPQKERVPTRIRVPSPLLGIPLSVYILVVSIMIFTLVLGCVFVLPSVLPKSPTDLLPALCSGNFQSTNTSIVPTPATRKSPDGETIGLSEGEQIFDLQRLNQQEVQDKLQAAQDIVNNPQAVVSSLQNAISSDPTDAEAQIYLENWRVLGSNHPHLTFVIGVNFASTDAPTSRGTLQGAFTAQKECNDQNRQDSTKTQIVLIIANISGSNSENRASSAKVVANQIVDQAHNDPTIVAIMGWPTSTDSVNVNHQLKIRESHLPMVSSTSSSDELQDMSNFFRVCPQNKEEAQMAANFLQKLQKKRIAILYDSTNAFSNNLKKDFSESIAKSNIVGTESYIAGNQSELQNDLNNVLAQNPDAIFFAASSNRDLFTLLKDISFITQKHNFIIIGGDELATMNDYKNPLPDTHNVYFSAFASFKAWEGTNLKPPFFGDYKTNFETLTTPTGLPSIDDNVMLGYDGILTSLHASQQVLSTKNTISASDLTQALKQITVTNSIQGITGRIAFDRNGDQDEHKMIFVEHIDGKNLVIDETHGCLLKDNCRL